MNRPLNGDRLIIKGMDLNVAVVVDSAEFDTIVHVEYESGRQEWLNWDSIAWNLTEAERQKANA